MPITLGCPSCGKRFRARDESAGKRVKCPYCQTAVPVPLPEEGAAPTVPVEPAPSPPPPRPAPPRPAFESDLLPPSQPRPAPSRPPVAPVRANRPEQPAAPADWGALPTEPAVTGPVPTAPSRPFPSAPPPELEPDPDAPPPAPKRGDRGGKPRPKPAAPEPKKKAAEKSPEQVLAKKWASVRRGLFWVRFSLLFVALLGFVEFGKAVYTRSVGELPKGEGWVQIDGYINSGGPNSIPLSKTDEINLATYGLFGALAGFLMVIGRLFSGGAPRNSGAGGMFALSGLLTLVAFVSVPVWIVCEKVPFPEEVRYARLALLVSAPLAEFWFLTALTASGLALKRPKVARQVGWLGFLFALIPVLVIVGWEQYVIHGRPKKPDADWLLYEQAAILMGWLIVVVGYWRAVGGVRRGALEFIRSVEDKDDEKS
ncbi:hypothetical protein R5W23_005730 [Gemmata sp. JC673]|uniref:Uncharacterized protein n=1 Tax=Gemmata algarum TaxID=2975278 RepID=A0ABU5ES34_9BACT|nr:hypothetical protein [Gemmata algarum]MDY3557881.1 hypothetical protein [Gemmata algarum]